MSFEPDEYAAFYLLKIRRARVSHRCSACSATIAPGQRYADARFGGSGWVYVVKRCGACELTFRHLETLARPEGRAVDAVLNCGESYADEWGSEPPDHIAALPFATAAEASALLEAS